MKLNIQRFAPDADQLNIEYDHITKGDGTKLQVDSAIRDDEGTKISTHYAKKTEIPTKTGDLINNGDGSTGWNKYINDIGTYEYYSGDYELKGLGVYDDDRLYFQTTHNNSNYNEILANLADIPYRTSELTNDSNFVSDASYVHTDNNYTTTEKNKLSGIASGAEVNVQSDWSQSDNTKDDYIKNKPSLSPVATQTNVGTSDRPVYLNNGTATQTNTPASGNYFRGIPFVTSGGVIEIGRYIDFHPTNDSTLDFSKRLDAGSGTTARTLTLPDKTGTIAITSDLPTKTSDLTNDSGFVTDISNKTNTSVLPNDSGEIKTKFRISNKGYTGSGSTIWYYKLCELPTDNNGDYASAIISGRIGGWVNDNMSYINALAWNRNGTGISLLDIAGGATSMNSIWNICDIVIYTDATTVSTTSADGGKDIIYLKCKSYYTFDLDVELFQSTATFLYDGTYTATEPSGTLVAQASTSTKRVEIINGKLYVAGNEMGKKSDIPTNTNQLTNGAGFITSSGSITGNAATATKATGDKNGNDITTTYQPKLVSGTNIKTINNVSLLGSGNISIGGGGTATDVQVNGTSITSGGVANLVTQTAYNSSSNKIATMSDLPSYATDVTAGLVKAPSTSALIVSSVGSLTCQERNFNDYVSGTSTSFISKGTLENALKGYHIEPTVLYDNASGTQTTLNLSADVSNYSYLEIYYGWNGGNYGIQSTKLDLSKGLAVNLSQTVYNNGYLYFATSKWTAGTTKLTLSGGEYWRIGTSGSANRTQTQQIAVYKVVGYK